MGGIVNLFGVTNISLVVVTSAVLEEASTANVVFISEDVCAQVSFLDESHGRGGGPVSRLML